MDKLTTNQQTAVKKMTDLKLTAKLLEAGMEEHLVTQMDRNALMNAWAEIIAAGKEKGSVAGGASAAANTSTCYNPELEKQRLAFEMELKMKEFALKEKEYEDRRRREEEEREERKRREEEEREERKRKEEEEREERKRKEEERQRREEEEREERKRREEAELELKRKEIALKEREIEDQRVMKERELQLARERDNSNKTIVHRAKLFGDAMKNTIAHMPTDVVELVSYFKDVEQLFVNFGVPEDLKAQLLRPYLNEKAKTLVSRMDPAHSTEYEAVKKMLLREFKLSPKVYLERFNNEVKKSEETYVLFSSRLKSLLEYYVTSRKVDENYGKLMDLLVCDRIKSNLPEGCLRHILAVESTLTDGWMGVQELADAIDLYMANRHDGDRPRAGAIGITASTKANASHHQGTPKTSFGNNHEKGGNSVARNQPAQENSKTCHACGSRFHYKRDCPDRDKASSNRLSSYHPSAKVNACSVRRRPKTVGLDSKMVV